MKIKTIIRMVFYNTEDSTEGKTNTTAVTKALFMMV